MLRVDLLLAVPVHRVHIRCRSRLGICRLAVRLSGLGEGFEKSDVEGAR